MKFHFSVLEQEIIYNSLTKFYFIGDGCPDGKINKKIKGLEIN